jgi:hypothetical protein
MDYLVSGIRQNFSIAVTTQRFPNYIYFNHRKEVTPISWDVKKQLFSKLPIPPMAQLDPVLESLCSLLNTRSLLQTLGVCSKHEAMDVVHTLCVPFCMGQWKLSKNIVFFMKRKKVDRTQEHRLLY